MPSRCNSKPSSRPFRRRFVAIEMTEYQDCRAARSALAEYVSYYLHERKHSSLGYLTPSQAERLLLPKKPLPRH